jgi:hypothetical protein
VATESIAEHIESLEGKGASHSIATSALVGSALFAARISLVAQYFAWGSTSLLSAGQPHTVKYEVGVGPHPAQVFAKWSREIEMCLYLCI